MIKLRNKKFWCKILEKYANDLIFDTNVWGKNLSFKQSITSPIDSTVPPTRYYSMKIISKSDIINYFFESNIIQVNYELVKG